jgi:quinolinate synthase
MASPFPSLVLSHDAHQARGSFAANQSACLSPDPQSVMRLDQLLKEHQVGIVAHYYMDPELQGILHACSHPLIHISDSLVMADQAVSMVKRGARAIVVLGVDFMAQNARALLDHAGYRDVPVYRVVEGPIGCSLADAAESLAYRAYLHEAAKTSGSVHVVYINTSLRSKAWAQRELATITCTSANVIRTVLQAFAQVPDANVWFGPDSYMGQNLATMLERYSERSDAEIAALHPAHTRQSILAARARFQWFKEGNCIVHHHFGGAIAQRIRSDYADALLAAHLEVPSELFDLALEASERGMGVVGSTSNILNFVIAQTKKARENECVRVVLGTEAGMTAAIVHELIPLLRQPENQKKSVEIIFPVADDAVTFQQDKTLAPTVLPGVVASEGCSTAGGCATCPFMKLNSLDALFDVLEQLPGASRRRLAAFEPAPLAASEEAEELTRLGTQPILAMRHFQATGQFPPDLAARMSGTPT